MYIFIWMWFLCSARDKIHSGKSSVVYHKLQSDTYAQPNKDQIEYQAKNCIHKLGVGHQHVYKHNLSLLCPFQFTFYVVSLLTYKLAI